MFSVQQKREISDAVQKILRSTMHPELPATGEVSFSLNVAGSESWSYATIVNNGAVGDSGVNPHNELMASMPEGEARGLIRKAEDLDPAAQSVPYTPDPRQAPDEFMREMLTQTYTELKQRITVLQDRDKIQRELYSEINSRLERLEEYFKEIIEDNLIQHHSDQLRNMMTAMKQLGNPQIKKSLEGG